MPGPSYGLSSLTQARTCCLMARPPACLPGSPQWPGQAEVLLPFPLQGTMAQLNSLMFST